MYDLDYCIGIVGKGKDYQQKVNVEFVGETLKINVYDHQIVFYFLIMTRIYGALLKTICDLLRNHLES